VTPPARACCPDTRLDGPDNAAAQAPLPKAAAYLSRVEMLHRHTSRREASADPLGPHAVLATSSDTAEAVLARIHHLQNTACHRRCCRRT